MNNNLSPFVLSFIGLGSNLNQPTQQVKQAIISLKQLTKSQFIYASQLYRSKPLKTDNIQATHHYKPQSLTDSSQQKPFWTDPQPDFINAVVAIKTALTPSDLLQALQTIEKKQNRDKTREEKRWGPRIIDLDLLLYGDKIIQQNTPNGWLTIPHPAIMKRPFVLTPLMEILAHFMQDSCTKQTLDTISSITN